MRIHNNRVAELSIVESFFILRGTETPVPRYCEDLRGLSRQIIASYAMTGQALRQAHDSMASGPLSYSPFVIYPQVLYAELIRGRLGSMASQLEQSGVPCSLPNSKEL